MAAAAAVGLVTATGVAAVTVATSLVAAAAAVAPVMVPAGLQSWRRLLLGTR